MNQAYPELGSNQVFDCITHAITQYNVWADEIREYDTNRNSKDDSSPFSGMILEHNGELNYHCYTSPFIIGQTIKGWVNCYYMEAFYHTGLVFSYYLDQDIEEAVNTEMIEAYTQMLTECQATDYKWRISKGKSKG